MTNYISPLTEALQRGTLALFVGGDLPAEVTGLPSRADLARRLARRHGLTDSDSLAAAAQQVARHGQRYEIVSYLRDQLDTTGKAPRPFHCRVVDLVQKHRIATIVTTGYDDLLKRAFQDAKIGVDTVVRGGDVAFASPRTPTLIRLYGDLAQVDTLVVTEDDHYGVSRDRDKEALLDEVRSVMNRNTVLFLGYKLADPDFNLLWHEVLDKAGRFAVGAYAAWPEATDAQRQVWADRRVRILDREALELLADLLGEGADSAAAERVAVRATAGHPAPVAPPLHFHDFDLLIGDPVDGRYPVHVLHSPAGEGEDAFVSPLGEAEVLPALWRIERGATEEPFLEDIGTRLFRALFRGDVGARYAESAGATMHGAGLRLRLRLDPPELHQLPWELLYDPEKREFLALSARSHVTRYLHVPRPTPPLAVVPPLRLLAAVAAPRNQVGLDLDAELGYIDQALRPLVDAGLVALAVEPHLTKQALRRRLQEFDPHVLHYVGHGGLDGDRGVLLVENDRGLADPLDGPTLGILLKRGSVRLAVLNACLSAREVAAHGAELRGMPAHAPDFARRRTALLGVGPALVGAGLGAVVAMQFSVADHSAIHFAHEFYTRLAHQEPVDECVARAREALMVEVGLGRADWATPVLFLRSPDGVLFPRLA